MGIREICKQQLYFVFFAYLYLCDMPVMFRFRQNANVEFKIQILLKLQIVFIGNV